MGKRDRVVGAHALDYVASHTEYSMSASSDFQNTPDQ